MYSHHPLRLAACNLVLLIVLLMLAHQSAVAEEPAGRLMFVHGQVWIERNGENIAAKRGDTIFAGDILVTEAASSAQIRFSDGGTNALRPDTRMVLHEYLNDQVNPGNSRKTTELVQGGLRSISGAIGRAAPQNVNYSTPVATMGIRGTTFVIVHNQQGTHLRVEFGAVAMQSQAGTRIARPGQAFRVSMRNQMPVQIPPESNVFEEQEQTPPGQGQGQPGSQQGSGNQQPAANTPTGGNNPAPGQSSNQLPQTPAGGFNPTTPDRPEASQNSNLNESINDNRANLLQEQACQAQGFSSCADRDNYLAAEQACQAQGFSSCADRDNYLAAEQACRDQGYASCADRDGTQPDEEQACLAQGFSSCAERDIYLAAEQICQAEGFASCQEKNSHLAAEQICKQEGYDSCADKASKLAAEQTCQQQGFASCAERNAYLATQEAKETNCASLGYNSCTEMLTGTQYASTPVSSTGGTQVMIGDRTYLLPASQTQWLNHGGVPVLGAFRNPTQVRIQTLQGATPQSGGTLAALNTGGTSFYWGVWSKNDFKILDPTTLAVSDTATGDLHYIAASQLFSGDAVTELSSIGLGGPVRFIPTGGTALNAMSTSNNALINVGQHDSAIMYDPNDQIFNTQIHLYYPDSAAQDFILEGYSIPLTQLLAANGLSLVLLDPSYDPAGSGTLLFDFTGNTAIDGAISELRVDFSNEGVQAYGNLVWQLDGVLGPIGPGTGQGCMVCLPAQGFTSLTSHQVSGMEIDMARGEAVVKYSNDWLTLNNSVVATDSTLIVDAGSNATAEVLWGYWEFGEYAYQGTDTPSPNGNFHYILADVNSHFTGDLNVVASLTFGLVLDTDLLSYNGTDWLNILSGSITLSPDSGTRIDVSLLMQESGQQSLLEGSYNVAGSLTHLPEVSLTNGSTGTISSATIEGIFLGSSAEGIAAWIEAMRGSDLFRGTAVFQQQFP